MSHKITVVNMIPNLLSGESNQDSEPNLAVNPVNPLEIAATAFTPSPNVGSPNSPVFYSSDGGDTWSLIDLIAGTPVRDQTLRFASEGGMLYAGVLWGSGSNIATINFDILRTNDFSGGSTMSVLASRTNDDQPFVQAATVPSGPDSGKDRVYVGSNDHAPANTPSTVDYSLDAAIAAPTTSTVRLEARSVSRDGFQTRPAIHPNGTVYAVFYAALSSGSFDVVVVRDDNWASGGSPFNALIDPGDLKEGLRVATGVNNPFLSLFIGQQRIGGDLSIVVDPRSSANVYLCFGDQQSGTYQLRVWRSTDSGVSWTPDIRIIDNATNPALAINKHGKLGFLYQQVAGISPNQRWLTTIEFTEDDFGSFTTHILANTPATSPAASFSPYLGDYLYMMTVDANFYGIFCANNTPDKANFPSGVVYQRNADFVTRTLLNTDNVTPVGISIDPFFFKVTPGPARLATSIADTGFFGKVCTGNFADELLTINNSGSGPLFIYNITSSSPDFLAPGTAAYPLKVHEGSSTEVEIRFRPTAPGLHTATITIFSNDPAGPHHIKVSGEAPTGRLVITGSLCFGLVKACCPLERTLSVCNVGDCALHVSSVAFKKKSKHWKLINNPFPATLRPGSCLGVVVRYKADEQCSHAQELEISSDDPTRPLLTLEVTGCTDWAGHDCRCCPQDCCDEDDD
jgi:hypothetical protein